MKAKFTVETVQDCESATGVAFARRLSAHLLLRRDNKGCGGTNVRNSDRKARLNTPSYSFVNVRESTAPGV